MRFKTNYAVKCSPSANPPTSPPSPNVLPPGDDSVVVVVVNMKKLTIKRYTAGIARIKQLDEERHFYLYVSEISIFFVARL